jgi:hypothetical protein
VNGSGVPSRGEVIKVTTAAPPPAPAAPSSLGAAGISDKRIDLSWTDNAGNEEGFKIERSLDGASFVQIDQIGANRTSYTDRGVAGSTTYHYRIRAYNDGGNSAYSNTASAATPAPPPAGTGTGLRGDYHDNIDFTALTLTRTDSTVNFDWGTGSPDPSLGADTFSVRWTGSVEPRYSETYTFYTLTDDGVRLWVNDVLIVDRWIDQAATEWSGSIALSAGTRYSLRMDFYENGGHAVARLSWESPSTPKEVIPRSQLYPPAPLNLPAAPSNLTATAVSSSRIDLSWTDNSNNETRFEIERSTDNASFTKIAEVGANVTSYSNTGLSRNTTYYYRVRACNGDGCSGYSNTASARTPPR